MCLDFCFGHVSGRVVRHVPGRVFRHVSGRVFKHVFEQWLRQMVGLGIWLDMCSAMYSGSGVRLDICLDVCLCV